MGIILKKRSHIYSRIPGGILIILFISISPLVIGLIGGSISEWLTGNPCHEGNCIWGVLGWLTFWTAPFGALVFIIFVVIVIADLFKLKT